jgi:hypothetical protein
VPCFDAGRSLEDAFALMRRGQGAAECQDRGKVYNELFQERARLQGQYCGFVGRRRFGFDAISEHTPEILTRGARVVALVRTNTYRQLARR